MQFRWQVPVTRGWVGPCLYQGLDAPQTTGEPEQAGEEGEEQGKGCDTVRQGRIVSTRARQEGEASRREQDATRWLVEGT